MSLAREAVLALVCGLPSRERYTRQILMLEAYFDGSTQDGEFLVIAGYMTDTSTWMDFSEKWKEKIDALDNGRAFKMARAAKTAKGLRRAKEHYKLIDDFGLVGIGCAIPIEPLARLVTDLNIDPRMGNPFYVGWRTAITTAVMSVMDRRISDKIQFCFDEQSEKSLVLKAWDLFHSNAPLKYKRHIAKSISFVPDDDVMPIQAADLIAGLTRIQFRKNPNSMGGVVPEEWGFKRPNLLFTRVDEAGFRYLLEGELQQKAMRESVIASLRFSTVNEPYPHWPRS